MNLKDVQKKIKMYIYIVLLLSVIFLVTMFVSNELNSIFLRGFSGVAAIGILILVAVMRYYIIKYYHCPYCGERLYRGRRLLSPKFCPKCGKQLDLDEE